MSVVLSISSFKAPILCSNECFWDSKPPTPTKYSFNIEFGIDSGWIDLLKSLLITVYVAYFGSRGAEKFKSIGNNK
jgi:hypothetical protein